MNWPVIAILASVFAFSDRADAAPVSNGWTYLCPLLLCVALGPLLATIQNQVTQRRWSPSAVGSRSSRRVRLTLSISLIGVWASCSLMAVTALEWPAIVRGNWGLGGLPALDDLVILLPIIASLWVATLILHDAQRLLSGNPESPRTSAVELRCMAIRQARVYMGLLGLPVVLLLLARDLFSMWPVDLAPNALLGVLFGALMTTLLLFPFSISLFWKSRSMSDVNWQPRYRAIADSLQVRPPRVRIWDTGETVINAFVVGLVPVSRLVILSDLMIKRCSLNELEVIIRHELAHLRQHHLYWRMAWLLGPLLVAGAAIVRAPHLVSTLPDQLGWVPVPIWAVGAVTYAGYVYLFALPAVRRTEYEADVIACSDLPAMRIEPERFRHYRSALLQMAATAPETLCRSSGLHPSIQNRVAQLHEFAQHPERMRRFARNLRVERWCFAIGLILAFVFVCAIT